MIKKLKCYLKTDNFKTLVGEIFYVFGFSLLFSFLGLAFFKGFFCDFFKEDLFSFTYSQGLTFEFSKSLALSSAIFSFIFFILFSVVTAFLRPSNNHACIGKRGKNLLFLVLLSLFGVLASVVLSLLLFAFSSNKEISLLVSLFITGIYYYLIYKLYLEEKTYSNLLIWEIFRFAIVGLVAAVFDFALSYIVQFIFFSDNDAFYVTFVATSCGFIIGVIINYLMSTFMVYKASKTKTGKTLKGILLFLGLAVIGLFIGIGIQYFLYDFLFLSKGITFFSYPIDFIIRTLIVMVYNYISRKILIYK